MNAAKLGIPVPGLMVSLGYLDAYRSAWLPANLIQAQRDYFGAHTYERSDTKGTLEADYVVLGGGNAKLLKRLPPGSCLGDNANAFRGGYRLWTMTCTRPTPERFVH
jgi:hypothetical protein